MSFTYKPELKVQGNQVGFIAEDVVQIVPEVVGLDAEGRPNNVDYGKFAPLFVKAIQQLFAKLTDLATTVAHFAENFTTKELTATNGTFESVATKQLCAIKSDGTHVCLTGDQLGALLSQTAAAEATISVPSPLTEIREPELAISVSSISTAEVASSTPEGLPPEAAPANDNAPLPEETLPANDNFPPAEASATGTE